MRGTETINAAVVTAAAQSSADAIAFYKGSSKTPGLGFFDKQFAAQTWVSWGVTVDGGGPTGGGPVPPLRRCGEGPPQSLWLIASSARCLHCESSHLPRMRFAEPQAKSGWWRGRATS